MILKNKNENGSYVQMHIADDATWMEVTDQFVNFLQGCGYVVEGSEIGQYLVHEYHFQIDRDKTLAKLADERVLEHEHKSKRRKKNAKRKSRKSNA